MQRWPNIRTFGARLGIMPPMDRTTKAFTQFAKGDFHKGLTELQADCLWRDKDESLDGPFFLGLPRRTGWGEALLLASLLRRRAAARNEQLRVFAEESACAILSEDPLFCPTAVESYEEARGHGARSPLAILAAALTGDLLALPFSPIETAARAKQRDDRNRVGVAWASVNESNKPICEKSVPLCIFAKILHHIDARVVSFQRNLNEAGLDDGLPSSWEQPLTAERKHQQWQARHGKCFNPRVQVIIGRRDCEKRWWEPCIVPARQAVGAALEISDQRSPLNTY